MTGTQVRLRPITEADLPDYIRWLNDADVTQFISREVGEVDMEKEREWFARISAPDTLRLSETDETPVSGF